jgi:hypothetical protein
MFRNLSRILIVNISASKPSVEKILNGLLRWAIPSLENN